MVAFDLASIRPRTLAPDQTCRVWTWDLASRTSTLVYENSDILLEAPNWLGDEAAPGDLILNGDGGLFRLTLSGELRSVPLRGIANLNNDHVLHPNGQEIFVSANDGQIHRLGVEGGRPTRVTTDPPAGLLHFLHGIHPRGDRLAFVGVDTMSAGEWSGVIQSVSVDGSDYRVLLDGPGSSDGSEYSPDGEFVYLNTEAFDGHAQLGRMRPDGSGLEQLTFDDRVNWFPHLAPDGRSAVYLSYPPGTAGHPADLPVQLRLVSDGRWDEAEVVVELLGGQGTINVNSWSPDSSSFAFVSYPS